MTIPRPKLEHHQGWLQSVFNVGTVTVNHWQSSCYLPRYFVQCTYKAMSLPPISLATTLNISEAFSVGNLDYFNEVRTGIDLCIFAYTIIFIPGEVLNLRFILIQNMYQGTTRPILH